MRRRNLSRASLQRRRPYQGEVTHDERLPRDLIATNLARLQRASATGAVEGFILKPNQVGTISEALETYKYD
jgi:enolase